MKRKEILMYVRASGYLKGLKPAIIYLKPNAGKIYNGKLNFFAMSIKNDVIYFQSLSKLFKKIDKKHDFDLKVTDIIRWQLIENNRTFNVLVLYFKDRKFLDIYYDKGIKDTFVIEDNISRTIEVLKNKGIKELIMEKGDKDEESNTTTEESD